MALVEVESEVGRMAKPSDNWANRIVGEGFEDPEQLLANPMNFRIHPKAQQDALAGVLSEVGWVQRVIVNRTTQHVIDGHLRVSLAITKGEKQVPVIYVDLTEAEEKLVLATIDPLSAMAATDAAKLDELLREVNTGETGVQAMLAALAEQHGIIPGGAIVPDDPGAQIDRAAELQAEWQTERGQLWIIPSKTANGEHRLLCGDSTNADDVARLMGGDKADAVVTDPPYGINIVGRNNTAGNFPGTNAPRLKAVPIEGDDKPFDPSHLLDLAPVLVLWGANHYADKLPASSKWLVWDKKDGAFAESDLGDCELAWTNQTGAARLLHHTWQGMYRAGKGERSERLHPTQKPVDLMKWCIEQVASGDIILDCYVGSGTTLVACEQTGRLGRAMEISEAYCAVVLQRLTDMGLEPRLTN